MDGMEDLKIAAVATPLAIAASWVIYNFDELGELAPIRRVLRFARHLLVVTVLLCPPAGSAALLWVVTQEQDRINQVIVEPVLNQITPTTTTTPAP